MIQPALQEEARLWGSKTGGCQSSSYLGGMRATRESSGLCWLTLKELWMSFACRVLSWGPTINFRTSTQFLTGPATLPPQQTVASEKERAFLVAHPELSLGGPKVDYFTPINLLFHLIAQIVPTLIPDKED